MSQLLSGTDVKAQFKPGQFNLLGGHEMAAGFEFNADSSFRFYYVYGAADRMADGKYTDDGDKLILHGSKIPGKDFLVIRESKNAQVKGTSVEFRDSNIYLIADIVCLFKKGKQEDWQYSDRQGIARTSLENCDTIFVMHQMFPDILTTIIPSAPHNNNEFEMKLQPTLAFVSFKDWELRVSGDVLTGSMPYLFGKPEVTFKRQD